MKRTGFQQAILGSLIQRGEEERLARQRLVSKMNKKLQVCCQHLGKLEKLVRVLWAQKPPEQKDGQTEPDQTCSPPGSCCQQRPGSRARLTRCLADE